MNKGAGAFILACMKKPTKALQESNLERAAKSFGIPREWAEFYVRRELERPNREPRK